MILLDSNILIRLVNLNDPRHQTAQDAIHELSEQSEELVVAPQCLYEFWVVSTRPTEARGGLGRTVKETYTDIQEFLRLFRLIDDDALFAPWLNLVKGALVSGTAAHDARLVALMKRAGIAAVLTFNTDDFARFAEIVAVSPAEIIAGATPWSGTQGS